MYYNSGKRCQSMHMIDSTTHEVSRMSYKVSYLSLLRNPPLLNKYLCMRYRNRQSVRITRWQSHKNGAETIMCRHFSRSPYHCLGLVFGCWREHPKTRALVSLCVFAILPYLNTPPLFRFFRDDGRRERTSTYCTREENSSEGATVADGSCSTNNFKRC